MYTHKLDSIRDCAQTNNKYIHKLWGAVKHSYTYTHTRTRTHYAEKIERMDGIDKWTDG